jgi:hypothetical protein
MDPTLLKLYQKTSTKFNLSIEEVEKTVNTFWRLIRKEISRGEQDIMIHRFGNLFIDPLVIRAYYLNIKDKNQRGFISDKRFEYEEKRLKKLCENRCIQLN